VPENIAAVALTFSAAAASAHWRDALKCSKSMFRDGIADAPQKRHANAGAAGLVLNAGAAALALNAGAVGGSASDAASEGRRASKRSRSIACIAPRGRRSPGWKGAPARKPKGAGRCGERRVSARSHRDSHARAIANPFGDSADR
jgi:hypothetical protein